MNINIRMNDSYSSNSSYYLDTLLAMLSTETDWEIEVERELAEPGKKSLDPVVALSITSAAISAIGLLVEILSFWQSNRPTFSITVQRGATIVELSNIKDEQLTAAIRLLDSVSLEDDMDVTIIPREV